MCNGFLDAEDKASSVPVFRTARPMDPSPSGGAAVTLNKTEFPPSTFPPYHDQGPVSASNSFQEFSEPARAVPIAELQDEVGSEFGGLASYFASQAEAEMDT